MKILAVDDDPFIVELVQIIAAGIGFPDVVTALSGEEALVTLSGPGRPFDCLLVDVDLPGKDGVEICASVRAIPAYRRVPIIMLARADEEAFIDSAFRAGATDVVIKPLDTAELGARMRAAEVINIALREATNTVSLRRAVSDGGHVLDLCDDKTADGFDDLVDYSALKSHLIELSRAGSQSSQVVAVKIDQIEAILARASAEEFLYALSETADAIGEILKPFGYQMAYAGCGVFVVVFGKASLESSNSIEAEIQYLLDEKNLEYDNGDPLDIDVSIGNPIRPTVTKMRRIAKSFDRAIARAENRAMRKHTEPRQLNVRMLR